jgi:hypothetical protein
LDAVLEDARRRGVVRVSLKVRVANSAARVLYARLGFQVAWRYTYPDWAAGLEMAVTLGAATGPGGAKPHQAPQVGVKAPLKPAQELQESPGTPPSGSKRGPAYGTCSLHEEA